MINELLLLFSVMIVDRYHLTDRFKTMSHAPNATETARLAGFDAQFRNARALVSS